MTKVHPKKAFWWIVGFSTTKGRKQVFFGIPRRWQCMPSYDPFCAKKKGLEYQ